jgi:hypothetical protein
MTVLASAIRATSVGPGSPVSPKSCFSNEPGWSKATMYSGRSYSKVMFHLLASFRAGRSHGSY